MRGFLVFVTCLCVVHPSWACDYTVRDIGFVDFAPPNMQLVVLFNDNLDETVLRDLQRDLNQQSQKSNCSSWNLRLRSGTLANLADPTEAQRAWQRSTDLDWSCWLVRSDGEARLLYEDAMDQRPNWESLLDNHLQRPLAVELQKRAFDAFAHVVIVESNKTEANVAADELASRAIAALDKAAPLLPRPITLPVHLIRIGAQERSLYATMLWALHGESLPLDDVQVLTIYGRGRLAGPTLQGETLNVGSLLSQLVLVGQSCECGTERNWVQYPHLPIAWPDEIQDDMAHHLGFAPTSSMVIEEVKRIILRGPQNLPNGRDEVVDVVRSTLSISNEPGRQDLHATVVQGEGWGFDSKVIPSTNADDLSPQLLAIPPGRIAMVSEALPDSDSPSDFVQRAPIAATTSIAKVLALLCVVLGSSLFLLVTLRRFRANRGD